MPFSRENIKSTSLTIGVVLIVLAVVGGLVLVARTPNPPPSLYGMVTGFPSIVAMQLLQLLRQEHAEKEIRKTRHDLKNELQPMQLAVDEVKMQSEHLRTVGREELRQMIRDAVRESMPTDLRQIVREVCGQLRHELRGE